MTVADGTEWSCFSSKNLSVYIFVFPSVLKMLSTHFFMGDDVYPLIFRVEKCHCININITQFNLRRHVCLWQLSFRVVVVVHRIY